MNEEPVGWEDTVKLAASELAGALGYHPHLSPWYYLKRESTPRATLPNASDFTPPSSVAGDNPTRMPNNWWHPTQKEARRRACEFPVEDPDFCEALREARLCREEGREPRQAIERLQILLDRCDSLDEGIKSTVLASARLNIQCAWGRRQEKLAAKDYASNFLGPEERSRLVGDCYDKPVTFSRRVATVKFRLATHSDRQLSEKVAGEGVFCNSFRQKWNFPPGKVHLELRGQPDGGIEDGDVVIEFKSRTRPPPNCPWPSKPPLYDAVQCVAYSWLWPTKNGRIARVVLVERRPSSNQGGFDLVCTSPATKELERSIASRCETFLGLVACARRKPGFLKRLENLPATERDAALRRCLETQTLEPVCAPILKKVRHSPEDLKCKPIKTIH